MKNGDTALSDPRCFLYFENHQIELLFILSTFYLTNWLIEVHLHSAHSCIKSLEEPGKKRALYQVGSRIFWGNSWVEEMCANFNRNDVKREDDTRKKDKQINRWIRFRPSIMGFPRSLNFRITPQIPLCPITAINGILDGIHPISTFSLLRWNRLLFRLFRNSVLEA